MILSVDVGVKIVERLLLWSGHEILANFMPLVAIDVLRKSKIALISP